MDSVYHLLQNRNSPIRVDRIVGLKTHRWRRSSFIKEKLIILVIFKSLNHFLAIFPQIHQNSPNFRYPTMIIAEYTLFRVKSKFSATFATENFAKCGVHFFPAIDSRPFHKKYFTCFGSGDDGEVFIFR